MKPKWLERSEVVTGLVLLGKLSADAVNPEDMYPPYDEVIRVLQKDGATDEDVVAACNYAPVRDAKSAVTELDGHIEPEKWVSLNVKAAALYKAGEELEGIAKDLKDAIPTETSKLLGITTKIDLDYRSMTPLDKVQPEEAQWILTGYKPIDDYLGGLPKAGLTLIAGNPGIGKTTLALEIAINMARKYPAKKVAFFSLEMLMGQVVARMLKVDKKLTKKERARILGADHAFTVGEVTSTAHRVAATEDLSLIVIDFADLMVEGEQSESVMGIIYRQLALLAKRTGIPVALVCQFSRVAYGDTGGKNSNGMSGIPKIHWIRYSSMAEIMSSLILLLYNPSAIVADYKAGSILPYAQDRGYIIAGKSRFGFLMGFPGAIQTEWHPDQGWGQKAFHYFKLQV